MIVVKAGGGAGLNMETVCADVAELVHQGAQVILVHGGSHETNRISEQLGHPPRMVTSISGGTGKQRGGPRFHHSPEVEMLWLYATVRIWSATPLRS